MTTYDSVIASGSVSFATGSTASIPLPSGAACSTPAEAVVLSLVIVRAGMVGGSSVIHHWEMEFTGASQPSDVDYADCLGFDGWFKELDKHLLVSVTRYMKVMTVEVAPGGTIEVPIAGFGDSGTLYYLVEQFRGLDGSLGTPSLSAGARTQALAGNTAHGGAFFTGTSSTPYSTAGGSYQGVVTVPADTGLVSNIQIGSGYCTPGYRDGLCAKVEYRNLLDTTTAFASVPFGLTGFDDVAFAIVNTLSGVDAPSPNTIIPGPFPWEVVVAHCLDPAAGTIPLGASWEIGPFDRALVCGSHIDPFTGRVIFGVVETPIKYDVLGVSFPYAAGGGPPLCSAPPVAADIRGRHRF